jgi:hypothetical protein
MTKTTHVRIESKLLQKINSAKGSKSLSQYISGLMYNVQTRTILQNTINSHFDHMKIDLPDEMQGMVSTLRVIALKTQDLNESERDSLMQELVDLALNYKQKSKMVVVGDLSFSKTHTSGVSDPETHVSHQVSSAGRSSEIPEDPIEA